MKYRLFLSLLFLFWSGQCSAIDISYDGRVVPVVAGRGATKWVSLLNREELPRWVRVSVRKFGPLPGLNREGQLLSGNTALGWTHVQEGWNEVQPQKLRKMRVEFLPPSKVEAGEYQVWLLFEQMNTSPKVLGEEQRGKSLQAAVIETYFLPILVQVKED